MLVVGKERKVAELGQQPVKFQWTREGHKKGAYSSQSAPSFCRTLRLFPPPYTFRLLTSFAVNAPVKLKSNVTTRFPRLPFLQLSATYNMASQRTNCLVSRC